jgi:hypothetical protein
MGNIFPVPDTGSTAHQQMKLIGLCLLHREVLPPAIVVLPTRKVASFRILCTGTDLAHEAAVDEFRKTSACSTGTKSKTSIALQFTMKRSAESNFRVLLLLTDSWTSCEKEALLRSVAPIALLDRKSI